MGDGRPENLLHFLFHLRPQVAHQRREFLRRHKPAGRPVADKVQQPVVAGEPVQGQ